MPFVFESLDEKAAAEFKAKVKKFQTVLSMTPARIIDRSRDIAFFGLGGQGELPPSRGEPPNHYAMLWKESHIALDGHQRLTSAGLVITLSRLAIPRHLKGELAEIKQALREAMTVYWEGLSRRPMFVTLSFPTPLYYD